MTGNASSIAAAQNVNVSAGQSAAPVLRFCSDRYEGGKFSTTRRSPSGNTVTSGGLKSRCFEP